MKKQTLALACLAAGVLAACGGGSSSPTSPSPSFAATTGSVDVTGTLWQSVKYGGGGDVPGLIFHPTSPDVLDARTDIGGIYRWDATASTWVALTDSLGVTDGFYMGSESIALDPNDDKRVYMSTGL